MGMVSVSVGFEGIVCWCENVRVRCAGVKV